LGKVPRFYRGGGAVSKAAKKRFVRKTEQAAQSTSLRARVF
jgi:hypothetical protein